MATTDTSTSTTAPVIRAVLVDLSGTVHIGDKIIPGVLEACKKLVQHKIAVRFLTNSTKSSRSELLDQLWKFGFQKDVVHADSLVTNTEAAKQLIQQHKLNPYCLVQESLLQDLQLDPSSQTSAASGILEPYNSVLVGLAPEALVYERLNKAFRIVMNEKQKRKNLLAETSNHDLPPIIIALHRGKYLRDVDGGLSLGPGGFVACLQEAAGMSDSDIAVMGKPSRDFFQAAIPEGISPAETVMIGDDVRQDVIGAKQSCLGLGILVKTGKYQEGDEDVDADGYKPDATVDSIVQAVDLILARNKS